MPMMLGRKPRRSDVRSLHFADFTTPMDVPKSTHYWTRKKPFAPGSWGNNEVGDCTFASQVNTFRRFERIEHKNRGTEQVDPEEVKRAYFACTQRLYGGGDTGAYEEDALNCSRSQDTCIHDVDGHPLLIDGYVRLDAANIQQVKQAVATSAGHGIKVCFALPLAFQRLVQEGAREWDIPKGQALTGDWEAGSWGGHSQHAFEYTQRGLVVEQTWDIEPILVTWEAWVAYGDEAHLVVDSADLWLRRKAAFDVPKFVAAVNSVSQHKVSSVAA